MSFVSTELSLSLLIINSPQNNTKKYNLTLNESHILYKSVLNKYWSALYKNENDTKIDFDLRPYPSYLSYTDPKRRQDFIYKETFKIGDILIYYNNHDTIINKTNHIIENITYEYGEYSYIFINNKFVGKNYENDKYKKRNEFTAKYYNDNNLSLFKGDNIKDENILEIGNLQTLFGKNYYVILRPSLQYNLTCEEGMFLNNTMKQCQKCPIGSYSNKKGLNKCYPCNIGTYSNKEGSTNCNKCEIDTYSDEPGSKSCKECPVGFYSDEIGLSSCKKCTFNNYENKTSSKIEDILLAIQKIAFGYYMRGKYI